MSIHTKMLFPPTMYMSHGCVQIRYEFVHSILSVPHSFLVVFLTRLADSPRLVLSPVCLNARSGPMWQTPSDNPHFVVSFALKNSPFARDNLWHNARCQLKFVSNFSIKQVIVCLTTIIFMRFPHRPSLCVFELRKSPVSKNVKSIDLHQLSCLRTSFAKSPFTEGSVISDRTLILRPDVILTINLKRKRFSSHSTYTSEREVGRIASRPFLKELRPHSIRNDSTNIADRHTSRTATILRSGAKIEFISRQGSGPRSGFVRACLTCQKLKLDTVEPRNRWPHNPTSLPGRSRTVSSVETRATRHPEGRQSSSGSHTHRSSRNPYRMSRQFFHNCHRVLRIPHEHAAFLHRVSNLFFRCIESKLFPDQDSEVIHVCEKEHPSDSQRETTLDIGDPIFTGHLRFFRHDDLEDALRLRRTQRRTEVHWQRI